MADFQASDSKKHGLLDQLNHFIKIQTKSKRNHNNRAAKYRAGM
jgi:hypothetical protein